MDEEKVDVKEQIEKIGENFNELKKTYVTHIKDHNVEIKSWTFTVNKADNGYIVDFAAKVEIMPKKK
jgi:hypothetical protein